MHVCTFVQMCVTTVNTMPSYTAGVQIEAWVYASSDLLTVQGHTIFMSWRYGPMAKFSHLFYLCRISLCPSYFCCKHYLEWSSSGFYGGRIVLMFLKLLLSLCSLYNNQRYLLKINIISCCSTAYSILLPSELNSYILLHLEVQLWCRVIAPLQLHSCTFFSVSYARHSTDLFILFEHISLVSLFKIFLN